MRALFENRWTNIDVFVNSVLSCILNKEKSWFFVKFAFLFIEPMVKALDFINCTPYEQK